MMAMLVILLASPVTSTFVSEQHIITSMPCNLVVRLLAALRFTDI
jgi:hypothetical protein